MPSLISILIPAHNAGEWLGATLESALGQTWPRVEIIVVENASTDSTRDVANAFASRGVRVTSIERASAAAARNRALSLASGEFVQYLDADDLLAADKLALQMAVLEGSQDALGISARAEFLDRTDPTAAQPQDGWPCVSTSDPASWLADLLGAGGRGTFVALHQWLTPRALIERAGPWNEDLTVNDDGEFFSRVILAAQQIRATPAAVAFYRRHRSRRNLSSAHQRDRRSVESMMEAWRLTTERVARVRPSDGLNRAIARHYFECALAAAPLNAALADEAEARALRHDPKATPPAPTSFASAIIRRILGWRLERRLADRVRRNVIADGRT